MQITQPCSAPSSPLASPGALSSTSFCMPANSSSGSGTNGHHHNHSACPIDTGDPNWQATKSTVRERNAAMFNNELIADIKFIVGSDGECSIHFKFFFLGWKLSQKSKDRNIWDIIQCCCIGFLCFVL